MTRRELDCSGYFISKAAGGEEVWPEQLRDIRDKDLLMSAFGALVRIMKLLKSINAPQKPP